MKASAPTTIVLQGGSVEKVLGVVWHSSEGRAYVQSSIWFPELSGTDAAFREENTKWPHYSSVADEVEVEK